MCALDLRVGARFGDALRWKEAEPAKRFNLAARATSARNLAVRIAASEALIVQGDAAAGVKTLINSN